MGYMVSQLGRVSFRKWIYPQPVPDDCTWKEQDTGTAFLVKEIDTSLKTGHSKLNGDLLTCNYFVPSDNKLFMIVLTVCYS